MGKKKNNKIILPPQLPPDVAEEEIPITEEDVDFVEKNRKFAGFLKNLDTKSITKHVRRVADQKEEDMEVLYEKRKQKKSLENDKRSNGGGGGGLEVDPVDALPVKTLDGKLYYKTAPKESRIPGNLSKDAEGTTPDDETDKSVVKLTKVERRAKLKKGKKEAKKQVKESDNNNNNNNNEEDAQGRNLQADVLAEVKEDLSSEELFARKRSKLAELGMALLADPESNIKSLKDLMQLSRDEDHNITKLGMLSLLAVFKDIIPGYRIRLPTPKEMEMTVSKAVKKMRFYESTLLSSYKAYLQKLVALEKLSSFKHVAVRCICSLLDAVPHFNFRENLLEAVVNNLSSPDDVIRKLCCTTLKSLFANEGKHGGEVTVDAVQLIAKLVKVHDCQLHPDTIEVFLSLSFDEDLGKAEFSKGGKKDKKGKKKSEESSKIKKRNRKDLQIQSKEEVDAELKAASFATDRLEKKKMQSETLSAIFQTYFRILKQTSQNRYKVGTSSLFGGFGANPLLAPCLNGLGKFSHLIDLDFMGDLMNSLKDLASGGGNPDNSTENCLTVTERLRCCIVAFKVMRSNLDALNVDLHEFFIQLYNLLLEYRPERDQGEVLAEALKTMLCEGRQHDMQRAAAFIKRLATFALCFGSAEAMAALVTLKDLLQKNIKCRNLLENDAAGGSLSGSVAGYQPCASDPNQSGAFASVLWELSLLSKHYHPTVSTAASSISSMANPDHQVYLPFTSARQAFEDLSVEKEAFNIKNSNLGTSNRKRKTSGSFISGADKSIFDSEYSVDEEDLENRMSEHFTVLRDIADNERLRRGLNLTASSISLYEEYKKQKKRKKQGDSKAIKR